MVFMVFFAAVLVSLSSKIIGLATMDCDEWEAEVRLLPKALGPEAGGGRSPAEEGNSAVDSFTKDEVGGACCCSFLSCRFPFAFFFRWFLRAVFSTLAGSLIRCEAGMKRKKRY